MPAEQVLELLDLLDARGIDVWVDGGWGVDALAGRQTREHGDLDLGVVRPHLDTAIEVLGATGYAVTDARFVEVTVQLTHAEGHRVDLHPSTPMPGGGTEQTDFDGNTFHIPPPEIGRIAGREVRCLPLSAQFHTHQGYDLRPQDHHDLALLNQVVWERASEKHVREYDELLAEARGDGLLERREVELLGPVLATGPVVVHFQSGHGLDDVGLVKAGARLVVGVDYSSVAVGAAQRRAVELGVSCRYAVAEVPGVPVRDGCADLVYTGKGALIWMRDIAAWARDVARVLRPGGHLFVYEAHPAVPLWTWDEDEPRIRPDRSYFAESHVNDTFPGNGAREWQWNLGQIVTAITTAGLHLQVLEEYAEPFWRPQDGTTAAA
ncbi:methyltransferase domain-containing protein [Kribbella sp. NBC_01510]|uniref:nucleotidyltransferase domain-containing protein n=1 Tax=Kribbella sp. NBC_01510 TaxID=2903581 RepID=UPI00386601E9